MRIWVKLPAVLLGVVGACVLLNIPSGGGHGSAYAAGLAPTSGGGRGLAHAAQLPPSTCQVPFIIGLFPWQKQLVCHGPGMLSIQVTCTNQTDPSIVLISPWTQPTRLPGTDIWFFITCPRGYVVGLDVDLH